MNVELTGYKENSVILVYTGTATPGCNLMIQVIFAVTNLLNVDSDWWLSISQGSMQNVGIWWSLGERQCPLVWRKVDHFGQYKDNVVLVIWRDLCDKIPQRWLITTTNGSISVRRGLCLFLIHFCQDTFSSVLHISLDSWPSEVPRPTVETVLNLEQVEAGEQNCCGVGLDLSECFWPGHMGKTSTVYTHLSRAKGLAPVTPIGWLKAAVLSSLFYEWITDKILGVVTWWVQLLWTE